MAQDDSRILTPAEYDNLIIKNTVMELVVILNIIIPAIVYFIFNEISG